MKLRNKEKKNMLLWMLIVGTSSTGPAEEYVARLDVEIDSAQQGWSIRYSSMGLFLCQINLCFLKLIEYFFKKAVAEP